MLARSRGKDYMSVSTRQAQRARCKRHVMQKPKFRTVRCIIHRGDQFLLVVHSNTLRVNRGKWGLPGGRIEPGECFEDAARREMREELRITLGVLHEVGDYRYKGSFHKVVGTEYLEPIIRFQRAEILKIGWHTFDAVTTMAATNRLHTGFEALAIRDFLAILRRQPRSSSPA